MKKDDLKYEIMPERQLRLYNKLKKQKWLRDFYLAGGTALALQIGHRRSVDFDFFSQKSINNEHLSINLSNIGLFKKLSEAKDTLYGILDGVRVSFISYNYPLIGKLITEESMQIASLEDIACMKLSAIASRGTKKDFIDIYFLLQISSLETLFKLFEKKYAISDYHYMLLKSLIYFEDAENDPIPILLTGIDWEDVKNNLKSKVKKFNII
ncbi:hypothetical protein BMS3Bbin03_01355 [bacterium BMS3Bbin03]|nr:hypothetical protein BMS3Bbin03_01355 [bacterium BMS3Bbin03]